MLGLSRYLNSDKTKPDGALFWVLPNLFAPLFVVFVYAVWVAYRLDGPYLSSLIRSCSEADVLLIGIIGLFSYISLRILGNYSDPGIRMDPNELIKNISLLFAMSVSYVGLRMEMNMYLMKSSLEIGGISDIEFYVLFMLSIGLGILAIYYCISRINIYMSMLENLSTIENNEAK
ncbi:MAG: hypothetical protein AAF624_13680 [Bacteroidota bacterium]